MRGAGREGVGGVSPSLARLPDSPNTQSTPTRHPDFTRVYELYSKPQKMWDSLPIAKAAGRLSPFYRAMSVGGFFHCSTTVVPLSSWQARLSDASYAGALLSLDALCLAATQAVASGLGALDRDRFAPWDFGLVRFEFGLCVGREEERGGGRPRLTLSFSLSLSLYLSLSLSLFSLPPSLPPSLPLSLSFSAPMSLPPPLSSSTPQFSPASSPAPCALAASRYPR